MSPAPHPRHLSGLPLGAPVSFSGAGAPARASLEGPRVTLAPLSARRDAEALFALAHLPTGDPTIWTYLPDGPYSDCGAFAATLGEREHAEDPLCFTALLNGEPRGMASFCAIVPEHGTIELGHIWFGSALARTAAATEALALLATEAFDRLGYRRLEWKCDALNARSRAAAVRFGFRYEGTFAQHRVVKGHNRDTAWFAITDDRWPAVRGALTAWLDRDNFSPDGRQRRRLADLQTPAARGAEAPGR
jgi:RimJ/RimL family protein N-acetyltransferase